MRHAHLLMSYGDTHIWLPALTRCRAVQSGMFAIKLHATGACTGVCLQYRCRVVQKGMFVIVADSPAKHTFSYESHQASSRRHIL